jgi:hypothetical protein
MSLWIKFKNKFKEIINEIDDYKILFDTYKTIEYNLLLFSYKGFPLDLFIDELLKTKFNIKNLHKNELIWNKSIIYYENQYFLEIDLNNPNISNDYSFITDMILFIIKNRPLILNKHLIIIKNIDRLEEYAYVFRIIIEKYYNNVYFICTTNKISKIESPIKSRFSLIRMRLFTINEIQKIFNKYLECNYKTNDNRNIIFNIFLAQVNINEPHLITKDFCEYNYPLIKNFISSKYDLNDIRQLSYKLSQYNLSIQDIILDLIKVYKEMNYNDEKIKEIIDIGADIDYILTISNKGREPIFIENLLCQILI